MTFSIPIDIKRCILEGIEPPDDAHATANVPQGVKVHRNISLSLLSAQTRAILLEAACPYRNESGSAVYHLCALPKFPLLMPDDDFAAAINDYAAKWGQE